MLLLLVFVNNRIGIVCNCCMVFPFRFGLLSNMLFTFLHARNRIPVSAKYPFRTASILSNKLSSAAKGSSTSLQQCSTNQTVPQHPSYRVLHDDFIEEYHVRAITYEHQKTGAQILSVLSKDDNKVFGITFRTPPPDSTGIPHVLEHRYNCCTHSI